MEARDKNNGIKKENERQQLTRKAEILDKTATERDRRYNNREN